LYKLERTAGVPAPLHEVFEFFSDPHNLARIGPISDVVQRLVVTRRFQEIFGYRTRRIGHLFASRVAAAPLVS
jgi:ligand-binding SRPBCC domain-containing protein